jgi:hypothetical protein
MTVTITRLYDKYDAALSAVRELEAAGISSKDISLLANQSGGRKASDVKRVDSHGESAGLHAEKDAGVGTVLGGGIGLLAGLGVLAIPGIGPVLGLGWLAATALGAATGMAVGAATGGIVGSLVAEGVPQSDADVYAEGLRRGGTLLAVRASDGMSAKIETILDRHDAVDIVSRGAAYRKSGWSSFDPAASPYELGQVKGERPRVGAGIVQ